MSAKLAVLDGLAVLHEDVTDAPRSAGTDGITNAERLNVGEFAVFTDQGSGDDGGACEPDDPDELRSQDNVRAFGSRGRTVAGQAGAVRMGRRVRRRGRDDRARRARGRIGFNMHEACVGMADAKRGQR